MLIQNGEWVTKKQARYRNANDLNREPNGLNVMVEMMVAIQRRMAEQDEEIRNLRQQLQ